MRPATIPRRTSPAADRPPHRRPRTTGGGAWAFITLLLIATPPASLAQTAGASPHDRIVTHDNVTPAGRLEEGVLTVALRAGVGDWHPQGSAAAPRTVEALGEEGGPLSIPSPLIRVPAGTTVHLSIRNSLGTPLRLHGACDRPATCEPRVIPAGTTGRVQFVLGIEGTFHYWAETSGDPLPLRGGRDSQLGGAIVVDRPGAPVRDRVFVMGLMREDAGASLPELTVINGRSWPHTERLEYRRGETVHWRVVNLTAAPHAMHLHGFYFTVESTGDGRRITQYAAGDRRTAVTEQMPPGSVMSLTWVPERPGNWLFHCHMLVHMMPDSHGVSGHHVRDSAAAGMAGLVLGVHVTGESVPVAADLPSRNLQLIVEPADRHRTLPSYAVTIADPRGSAPRLNDRGVPGPVMVLTRGEPVAVDVVNRLTAPTAIHWHGIELESYDDGVPDFGGHAGSVTPAVAPGGRFIARFTPSRAGTFIYHTHWHDPGQLAAGIYGPLIVLEPGETYDPSRDHIIVLGLDGPYVDAPGEPFVVNGEKRPRPLELEAGVPHRLRFINITPDNVALTVQLLSGFDPIRWTLVGKDGAATPSGQRTARLARQLVSVGETYDFEVAPMPPAPVGMWMELRRGNGELLIQWPVRVH